MERMALAREYEIYEGPGPVKSSPFIRKLHDVIGPWEMVEGRGRAGFDKSSEDPPCLVFEWMEHVLWNVRAEHYRHDSLLPKMIARSVLEALDLFASANAIHTGKLPLQGRSSGVDNVRCESKQHIFVKYRQRFPSGEIGRSWKLYVTGRNMYVLSNDLSDAGGL